MVKRERQRYILFKIIREPDIGFEQKEVINSIWQSIWRYFGMKIANKIGLWIVCLRKDTFRLIVISKLEYYVNYPFSLELFF